MLARLNILLTFFFVCLIRSRIPRNCPACVALNEENREIKKMRTHSVIYRCVLYTLSPYLGHIVPFYLRFGICFVLSIASLSGSTHVI